MSLLFYSCINIIDNKYPKKNKISKHRFFYNIYFLSIMFLAVFQLFTVKGWIFSLKLIPNIRPSFFSSWNSHIFDQKKRNIVYVWLFFILVASHYFHYIKITLTRSSIHHTLPQKLFSHLPVYKLFLPVKFPKNSCPASFWMDF